MSVYSTTVTIPLTVVADDRETAAVHVEHAIDALLTDVAHFGASRGASHVDPLRTVAPAYIVQHGHQAGTRRVVSVKTGRPVNDVVYTDADGAAPFELRDRLNAEAAAR